LGLGFRKKIIPTKWEKTQDHPHTLTPRGDVLTKKRSKTGLGHKCTKVGGKVVLGKTIPQGLDERLDRLAGNV